MTKSSFLDPPFASARVLVISDFNCPYCFALNEWIHELGASNRVRWVGIEHLPSLTVESTPDPDAQALLRTEVATSVRRSACASGSGVLSTVRDGRCSMPTQRTRLDAPSSWIHSFRAKQYGQLKSEITRTRAEANGGSRNDDFVMETVERRASTRIRS